MDILRVNRNLILVEGIIFTALGILAVSLPFVSTLATELFIGWLLLIGGAIQLYRTFKASQKRGFYTSLFSSILNIVLGILLIAYPVAGILSLALLLVFFFILQGASQIILAFQYRHIDGWYWLLINGILALLLAFLIGSGWPGTAFWILGLLVGINMIFFGISLIFLSFGLSKYIPDETDKDREDRLV